MISLREETTLFVSAFATEKANEEADENWLEHELYFTCELEKRKTSCRVHPSVNK